MGSSKVIKSGIWYTLSNFLLNGISFLTTSIFARLLSKEEYGEFSNFVSWISIASIFITLNTSASVLTAQEDYRGKEKEYTFSLILLSTFLSLISLILGCIFPNKVSDLFGINIKLLIGVLTYIISSSVIEIFQMWQRFKYKYKLSVIMSLSLTIVTNVLSILLVICLKQNRLNARYIGYILPTIIAGIPIIIYYFIKGKSFKLSMWIYAIRICLPYIPHKLSLYVLSSSDRIMITQLCGAADNALYSIGASVGMIVTILVVAINSAYAPWLAERMMENNFEKVKKTSLICMIGFSWVALGVMFCTPEVLYIMGGEQYMRALPVIAPIEMGCICQFVYGLYVDVEQFSKKTSGMAVASFLAASINVVLNMLFIPVFGYIAAAYTTLLGYIALLFFHIIIIYKIHMNRYFDTKKIFFLVLVLSGVTIGMNILYQHTMLRYIFLALYIVQSMIIVYKNRRRIISEIK